MANQKGMPSSFLLLITHDVTYSYYSIALVELANESAAEQACTKLSETLV